MNFMNTLEEIYKQYKIPIIVSTHPRTKKRLNDLKYNSNENIYFSKPFGFFDYAKLQINSLCVISDSGTITEESSILNFPAITIRNSHERPEGMDAGILIMSGLKKDRVLHSLSVTIKNYKDNKTKSCSIQDFGDLNISEKILKIVLSYTDFVDSNVWKKNN